MNRRDIVHRVSAYAHPESGQIELRQETVVDDMVAKCNRIIVETTEDSIRKALVALGWTPPAPKVDPRTLDLDREFTRIGQLGGDPARAPMIFHIADDKINVAGVCNAEQFAALAALSRNLKA